MKTIAAMPLILATCMCALLLSGSQASAVVIDDFTDDMADLKVNSVTQDQFDCQTGLGNVFGGSRKIHLHWVDGDPGPDTWAAITSDGGGFYFDYSNPADGIHWSTVVSLLYDADPTPLTNDGTENAHFDLTGASFFYAIVMGADVVTTAHWTLTDQDSSDTVDVPIPLIAFLTPTALFTPFGSFTGIDFSDLKSIEFSIDGPNVGDYRVDEIGTTRGFGQIPEPLTMLGVFLGLGSVGAYIRKRRVTA